MSDPGSGQSLIADNAGTVEAQESAAWLVAANISDAAAVEHQQLLLQTILDNIPVMITLLDRDGRLVYFNAEASRLLGWTQREIREHPDILGALLPEPDLREAGRDFVLKADRTWQEWRPITKDGRELPSLWMNVRVGELILGIGIDVSERHREREERDRARLSLEERVERKIARPAPYGLTFRELTVLALVAQGQTDREIARALSIGLRTVQTHISNILSKMGAETRTEAGVRAVRERMVE